MSTLERPGAERPRSKSAFSFKSDKSHKSHNSKGAIKTEARPVHNRNHSKDEHKPHFHTKADPNSAMNEVQPSTLSPSPWLAMSSPLSRVTCAMPHDSDLHVQLILY